MQQVPVHHIQLPGGAGFIQNQQVAEVGQHGAQQFALVLPGLRPLRLGHLEDKAGTGLPGQDAGPQCAQRRQFGAGTILEELQDGDRMPGPQRPQRQAHGRRGFAIAVAAVKVDQAGFGCGLHQFVPLFQKRSTPSAVTRA